MYSLNLRRHVMVVVMVKPGLPFHLDWCISAGIHRFGCELVYGQPLFR